VWGEKTWEEKGRVLKGTPARQGTIPPTRKEEDTTQTHYKELVGRRGTLKKTRALRTLERKGTFREGKTGPESPPAKKKKPGKLNLPDAAYRALDKCGLPINWRKVRGKGKAGRPRTVLRNRIKGPGKVLDER